MSNASGTIHYNLGTPDDLSRLLNDLPDIEAGTIVVAFDSGSSAFPTDLQLARLVGAGWDRKKRLVIETVDTDLAERALMLGFDDSAVVSDAPALNFADTQAIKPEIVARSDDPSDERKFDTTASLATYRPEPASAPRSGEHVYQHTSGHSGTFHHVNANWTAQARTVSSRDNSAPAGSEAPTSYFDPATSATSAREHDADDHGSEAEPRQQVRTKHRPRSRRRRRAILAAAIVAPVFVIGIVAAMAVFLLPTADVTVVPEEEAVSSSMTYGLAIGGAEYDVVVEPTTASNTVTAESTRDATGERFEPDGTASGQIQITNPLTSEVTVPGGSEVTGENGITYYTSEDIRIEAADPFGSMSFGSATVGVYASVAGPDGNVDAGMLTGQFGSGLFYTNPQGIFGGTMLSISVIEEADINQVHADVEQELLERAEREFMESLSADEELVPGTVEVGEPEIEVEGEAGEDGESVSASGSIRVSAQVYDPEKMHQVAGEEADRLLTREGRSDQVLRAETVQMRDPESINGDETAFRIEVEATARKVISESEQEAIVQDLVGLNREDAESRLAEHPKIKSFEIEIAPDWLPDRMPEILSRIDLSVNSSEQTAATR